MVCAVLARFERLFARLGCLIARRKCSFTRWERLLGMGACTGFRFDASMIWGDAVDRPDMRYLFEQVAAGCLSVDDALARLNCANASFGDLGYAKPDFARASRQGVGEVVYGEGKTAGQIEGICRALMEHGQPRVLVTRLDDEKAALLATAFVRDASGAVPFRYSSQARLGMVGGLPEKVGAFEGSCLAGEPEKLEERGKTEGLGAAEEPEGLVVVLAAGTSDVPVAEEAALTAEFLGSRVARCYDVGVAGIHRLFACADELARARVVVAVAGMEGALPSVVAGLVSCPVIAVPTSVGYGASFGGVSALLAMLNSCASGVSVVNIDNGFGAGYQAHLINGVRSIGKTSLLN